MIPRLGDAAGFRGEDVRDSGMAFDNFEPLRRDQHHSLAELEASRHALVRTILAARWRCEQADAQGELPGSDAESARQLLSAAVARLEDLDDRLHILRESAGREPQHDAAAEDYSYHLRAG